MYKGHIFKKYMPFIVIEKKEKTMIYYESNKGGLLISTIQGDGTIGETGTNLADLYLYTPITFTNNIVWTVTKSGTSVTINDGTLSCIIDCSQSSKIYGFTNDIGYITAQNSFVSLGSSTKINFLNLLTRLETAKGTYRKNSNITTTSTKGVNLFKYSSSGSARASAEPFIFGRCKDEFAKQINGGTFEKVEYYTYKSGIGSVYNPEKANGTLLAKFGIDKRTGTIATIPEWTLPLYRIDYTDTESRTCSEYGSVLASKSNFTLGSDAPKYWEKMIYSNGYTYSYSKDTLRRIRWLVTQYSDGTRNAQPVLQYRTSTSATWLQANPYININDCPNDILMQGGYSNRALFSFPVYNSGYSNNYLGNRATSYYYIANNDGVTVTWDTETKKSNIQYDVTNQYSYVARPSPNDLYIGLDAIRGKPNDEFSSNIRDNDVFYNWSVGGTEYSKALNMYSYMVCLANWLYQDTIESGEYNGLESTEEETQTETPSATGGQYDGYYGSRDFSSDDVTIPQLPSLSAIGSGFCTLYAPTINQINSLSSFLWSDLFSIDTLKKLFSNPIDLILGINILPLSLGGVEQEIKVGGIGTGVNANKLDNQYMTYSCGQIFIDKKYNSFLDYAPYTKCQLYLPYCNTINLNINDIVGKWLGITYHIDLLNGSCMAYVTANDTIVNTCVGNLATQIPVTSQDYKNVVNNSVGLLTSGVATVGAFATGGVGVGLLGAMTTGAKAIDTISSIQPNIYNRGGVSGGTCALFNNRKPYLIFNYPNECKPENFKHNIGETLYKFGKVGDFSGYTVFDNINTETTSLQMPRQEIDEIVSILKGGVYL